MAKKKAELEAVFETLWSCPFKRKWSDGAKRLVESLIIKGRLSADRLKAARYLSEVSIYNAKASILDCAGMNGIRCAAISIDKDGEPSSKLALKLGHSKMELAAFLEQLDFYYHNDYGHSDPKITGIVWLEGVDNPWIVSAEEDGRYYWEFHQRPRVPDELLPGGVWK
jgi:hypothetical protein